MNSMRARRLACVLVIVATLSSGACGRNSHDGAASAEPERWSGFLSDLRVQWSASPGIDLLTLPTVAVRAYVESMLLAKFHGNLDSAYPGFTDAVAPNEPPSNHDFGAQARRPATDYPLTAPMVGNDMLKVSSVDRSGAATVVKLCDYNYTMAKQQANDSFAAFSQSGPVESRGILAVRIEMLAPPEGKADAPRSGSALAPYNDVFGGWRITSYLTSGFGGDPIRAEWPEYDADAAACVERAPDSVQRRVFLVTGEHPRSDFPTSPAAPGWPERSK